MNLPEKSSQPAAFSFRNPVIAAPLPGLAASTARRLPRWALIGLLLLYVSHGIFDRDPWRGDDLLAMALGRSAAEAMLNGNFSSLLLAQFHALPNTHQGPLWSAMLGLFMLPVYVVCAMRDAPLAITLLDDLARIPLIIAMLMGLTATWKAADRFARRREAQPIDPLGVGPKSRDFGKTLGDCTLLLCLGTLGVVYPWHQAGTAAVGFLLQGLLLWSLAGAPETPKRAAVQLAIVVFASLLTVGPGLAIAQIISVIAIFRWIAPYRLVIHDFLLRWIMLLGILVGAWTLACVVTLSLAQTSQWWEQWLSNWVVIRFVTEPGAAFNALRHWFNESLWKWWPLWPIALFGLWVHRRTHFSRAPHWSVPLICVLAITLLGLLGPSEWKIQQLIPVAPLALIAAFSLLSLSRPLVNLIDWFAVTLFTALGIFIWLYWIALNFGWPENLALRVALNAPGVTGSANLYELLIGVAATLAWVSLVIWRIRRGNPKLWRPVVLTAGGLTLAWVLLVTLWLSAIDRMQGQQVMARAVESGWVKAASRRLDQPRDEIQEHLVRRNPADPNSLSAMPVQACVELSGQYVPLDVMAIAVTRLPVSDRQDCLWRLAPAQMPIDSEWTEVWRSAGTEDRRSRERVVLLERTRANP